MPKKGYKFTLEARANMAAAQKGRKHTKETKAKMSAANKGKVLTSETKAKISRAKTGFHSTPKTCAILVAAHLNNPNYFGRTCSPDTILKMQAAQKGKKHTPESKAKRSRAELGCKNPFFGKHHSKETRVKISKATWKGGPDVSRARTEEKRRGLGYIPLNDKFIGGEGHHINKSFVIHMPKEMHRSVSHNVFTGKNMGQINTMAIDYCYGD